MTQLSKSTHEPKATYTLQVKRSRDTIHQICKHQCTGVDKPAGAAGAARRQLQVSQAGHGLSQSGHYSLERNLLTRVAKTLPGTQTHAKQMVSD